MKKKIFSIGMIIVLVLSSMLLSSTPAAAADRSWSSLLVPSAAPTVNQLALNTQVTAVTVAPNGDIFAIDSATPTDIYKSVDGGRVWGKTTVVAAAFSRLAISPAYETDSTVFAASGAQVYISNNGGTSYTPLGAPAPAGVNSIAVAPNYAGGTGEVMIGCSNGEVYLWGTIISPTTWAAQGLGGTNVVKVAYSPSYVIDQTRVAIDGAPGSTNVHTKVASALWDANLKATQVSTNTSTAADLAFPSDFNASLDPSRTLYVSTISGGNDSVYRVSLSPVASPYPGSSTAINPFGDPTLPGNADQEVLSLAFSGSNAAGTLFAGANNQAAVWRTSNPSAYPATSVQWMANSSGSVITGAAGTFVALPPDFSTSNKVYAGTSGPDSAFNVSADGGITFYQSGLINSQINTINDIQAVSATELFMVTDDGLNQSSVWKTTDGGLSWYRHYSYAAVGATSIVRLSPDYGTDSTLIFAETGPGATNIRISNDGGKTWAARVVPAGNFIADIVIKDMYSFYIGDAADDKVQGTINGGWVWGVGTGKDVGGAALTTVTDVEIDLETGHILAGLSDGTVFRSADNNLTWVKQGAGVGAAATAATALAFDPNYSSNNYIYAASVSGNATPTPGVKRFTASAMTPPTVPWTSIVDGSMTNFPGDVMVAPDGTLYASDLTAANTAGTAGGVVRVLNPTAIGIPTNPYNNERVSGAIGDGLTAGSSLGLLTMAEGSNVIFAVNGQGISTYTDTLTTAAPNQKTPAADEVLTSTTAFFSWDAVAGATKYQVQYDIRSDWANLWTTTTSNAADTSVVVLNLTSGASYYWRVRVMEPVMGPWSETHGFVAQLGVTGPTAPAPVLTGPTAPGATNAPLLPAFQWGAVKGATGYDFQLAKDAGMTDTLVDTTLGAVNVYTATTPLSYSTTYYWRVRAVSPTSTTDWSSVVAFTTMDEPVDPGEGPGTTVIVPTQPAPTINIPTQPAPQITVTTGDGEGVAPGYIWAVIIIGAVLVIALIVLIVRTRRTV